MFPYFRKLSFSISFAKLLQSAHFSDLLLRGEVYLSVTQISANYFVQVLKNYRNPQN